MEQHTHGNKLLIGWQSSKGKERSPCVSSFSLWNFRAGGDSVAAPPPLPRTAPPQHTPLLQDTVVERSRKTLQEAKGHLKACVLHCFAFWWNDGKKSNFFLFKDAMSSWCRLRTRRLSSSLRCSRPRPTPSCCSSSRTQIAPSAALRNC